MISSRTNINYFIYIKHQYQLWLRLKIYLLIIQAKLPKLIAPHRIQLPILGQYQAMIDPTSNLLDQYIKAFNLWRCNILIRLVLR